MRRFRLNKVVRDGPFEHMKSLGQSVEYKVLKKRELVQALQDKLAEELSEFDPGSEDPLRELADLQEVIDALTHALGSDPEKLRRLQGEVRSKRGSFDKRIFIETVTLADDDPWVKYYSNNPERFPEINDNE